MGQAPPHPVGLHVDLKRVRAQDQVKSGEGEDWELRERKVENLPSGHSSIFPCLLLSSLSFLITGKRGAP